jgi:hypothetical protein
MKILRIVLLVKLTIPLHQDVNWEKTALRTRPQVQLIWKFWQQLSSDLPTAIIIMAVLATLKLVVNSGKKLMELSL